MPATTTDPKEVDPAVLLQSAASTAALPPLAPASPTDSIVASVTSSSSSQSASQRKRREVVQMAEHGQWEAVIAKCREDPSMAQIEDEFGMLPLHWACTEPSIPLESFEKLMSFFPQASQQDNLSGMLPLHVAITSRMPGLHINALLQEYPQALLVKDSMNKYPIDLAIESNLPKFTISLIQKFASSQSVTKHFHPTVVQTTEIDSTASSSCASCDSPELLSPTSTVPMMSRSSSSVMFDSPKRPILNGCTNSNNEDVSVAIDMDSNSCLTSQLKELVMQIQQLGADIRSSSISSASTYRSSLSSSSSYRGASPVYQVLWNPVDKLGITFEPLQDDCGAKVTKISPKSDALGIESLQVGDVLVSINGASVSTTRHVSIMRFLKHSKVTCKLKFSRTTSSGSAGNISSLALSSSSSSVSSQSRCHFPEGSTGSLELDQNTLLYARVVETLEATLKKVCAVEERIRRTSTVP